MCPNKNTSCWEKTPFLNNPRRGREGSVRARTAVCVNGPQRTRGRRGGRELGSSKNCKTMGADGRDTLNHNGEWPLFVSANHGLALWDIFFSTAKIATSYIRSIGEAKHVLTTSSRDSESKHSCGTLLCTPNRHPYPSRTTTSSQHIYLCKYLYVCMYGQNFQQSMNQPVMVANPARGQLSRKIIFFPIPVRT